MKGALAFGLVDTHNLCVFGCGRQATTVSQATAIITTSTFNTVTAISKDTIGRLFLMYF